VIKVNSNSDVVLMVCTLDMMCENSPLSLWCSSQKPITPVSSWKTIPQIPIEGHFIKYLTSAPQKLAESSKTKKVKKNIMAKRSLRRHDNQM